MAKPSPQSLSDLLEGIPPPLELDNTPTRQERPSYRRDGLYGATPFQIKQVPEVIALTTEQVCKHCGNTSIFYAGTFREFVGTGLMGAMTYRNRITAAKGEIERVINTTEEVPYCPSCLGRGESHGA